MLFEDYSTGYSMSEPESWETSVEIAQLRFSSMLYIQAQIKNSNDGLQKDLMHEFLKEGFQTG